MLQREIIFLGLLSLESPKYWDFCNKTIDASISSGTKYSYVIGLDRVSKKNKQELHSYIPNLSTIDVSVPIPCHEETVHEKRVRYGMLYNRLFDHVRKIGSQARYGSVIEGDLAFIQKDWDITLTNELDNKFIIIGQEYGVEWPLKFQDFPCLNFCVFDLDKILSLDIDSRGSGKPLDITKENSYIFGLHVGKKLNREIGWKWPLKIKQAGYDGKCLRLVRGSWDGSQLLMPKSKKEKIMYKKHKIKALYEMHFNDIAIIAHMSKSTCLEFNKHPFSKFWIKRISDICGVKNV